MNNRTLIFQEYKRKPKSSYLREVTQEDVNEFREHGVIYADKTQSSTVSISDADLNSGSPKVGDMIAVNENITTDQWLINKTYFHENFCVKPTVDNDYVTISK